MTISIHPPQAFSQMGGRENQEDAYCPHELSTESRYFVVCDGVGGIEGGEIASTAVAERIDAYMRHIAAEGDDFGKEQIEDMLCDAYHALNNTVTSDAATTLTLLYIGAESITMIHIGDSRIYHFRPGKGLLFHTRDHSLVAEYVAAGMISEEATLRHPQRNIITRCMQAQADGERAEATVNITTDIAAGDVFLLCSDGVYEEMPSGELTSMMCMPEPLEERCRQLAERCQHSHDNNTAILIEVAQAEKDTTESKNDEWETCITHDPTRHDTGNRLVQFLRSVLKI